MLSHLTRSISITSFDKQTKNCILQIQNIKTQPLVLSYPSITQSSWKQFDMNEIMKNKNKLMKYIYLFSWTCLRQTCAPRTNVNIGLVWKCVKRQNWKPYLVKKFQRFHWQLVRKEAKRFKGNQVIFESFSINLGKFHSQTFGFRHKKKTIFHWHFHQFKSCTLHWFHKSI